MISLPHNSYTSLDRLPYGIRESDPAGIILYGNLAYHRMLGFAEGTLHGKSIWALLASETEKRKLRAYLKQPDQVTQACTPYFTKERTESGQIIAVRMHWHDIYDTQGQLIGFVTMIFEAGSHAQQKNDFTGTKGQAVTSEMALLTQKLAECHNQTSSIQAEIARASRLKDEFLASISHELRTPLNGILGLSEALQEEVYGTLNERQKKSLQSIKESGRHLLDIINDVLDIAKINAGKLPLLFDQVPLRSVCQASLALVKPLAEKKQLKMMLDFDEQVAIIQADGRRLKQILVNLLRNAIKFTPATQAIGITIQGIPTEEIAQLTVWDTGIGMSQADMAQLFHPFIQIDSCLSRHYEGIGLGLALTRRLTELHGGSLAVNSEVDKGSQFIIALPWSKDRTVPEEPGSKEATMTFAHSPTVLLIEENERTIDMISDDLSLQNVRVHVARNCAEALERIKQIVPDIILLGLPVPGVNDIDMIRCVKANDQTIPLIALSGLIMPGDCERCLQAGVKAYYNKPVTFKMLYHLMQTYLPSSPKSGHGE